MSTKLVRNLTGILLTIGLLCLVSTIALAVDYNFVGVWKGTLDAAAAKDATPAPAPEAAPAAPSGGGGGGRGGGRGGGGGLSPIAAGKGPQKMTLRVKVAKDKATGNFTFGSGSAEDIQQGHIEGNKLTFKTGLPPATIYDYTAVLNSDELSITRTAEGGRGKPSQFTLSRSK